MDRVRENKHATLLHVNRLPARLYTKLKVKWLIYNTLHVQTLLCKELLGHPGSRLIRICSMTDLSPKV